MNPTYIYLIIHSSEIDKRSLQDNPWRTSIIWSWAYGSSYWVEWFWSRVTQKINANTACWIPRNTSQLNAIKLLQKNERLQDKYWVNQHLKIQQKWKKLVVNLPTTWEVTTPEIKKTDEEEMYIHFLKADAFPKQKKRSNNLGQLVGES